MNLESPLLGLSQRLPPANLQAEQALLGAILANNRAYEMVAGFLEPQHFADAVHAYVYEAAADLILDGRVADAVTLKSRLEESGALHEVGGSAYLAQLLASMVGITNAREYARAIHDTWLRRQLIEIGESIVNNGFGAEPDLDGLAQRERAEQLLSELAGQHGRTSRVTTVGKMVKAAVERAEQAHRTGVAPGVVFGMPTVDRALDGLVDAGTLTLLAGLPGSGKTSLIGQMGKALGRRAFEAGLQRGLTKEQAARQPGMLLLSLEMPAEEIGIRLAAEEARIPMSALRKGELDLERCLSLANAVARTEHYCFRIADMKKLPFRLMVPRIKMLLRQQPEHVVAIDHLLLMGTDPDRRVRGLDASSVAAVTSGLKDLSVELGIAIIVLTHTGRPVDGIVRRPTASNVKWAGEGDADNVLFVHRPIMLMDSTPPVQGREGDTAFAKRKERWYQDRERVELLAELVVAKQRQGPGGVFPMRWDGPTTSLREITENEAPRWVTEEAPV